MLDLYYYDFYFICDDYNDSYNTYVMYYNYVLIYYYCYHY